MGIPLRVMVSYVHIYQALFVTVDFGYALGVIRPDFGVIINAKSLIFWNLDFGYGAMDRVLSPESPIQNLHIQNPESGVVSMYPSLGLASAHLRPVRESVQRQPAGDPFYGRSPGARPIALLQ